MEVLLEFQYSYIGFSKEKSLVWNHKILSSLTNIKFKGFSGLFRGILNQRDSDSTGKTNRLSVLLGVATAALLFAQYVVIVPEPILRVWNLPILVFSFLPDLAYLAHCPW